MKIYRNRWYILDSSIIGIIARQLQSADHATLQRVKHAYVDSSFIRAAMYPNGAMPQLEIKIKGPEYLNYFQLLRGAEFTIEQAAVWWARKGNKRFKIEPGLTGAVSGAFLEDVPDRKLTCLVNAISEEVLIRLFDYMNLGFKGDSLKLVSKVF